MRKSAVLYEITTPFVFVIAIFLEFLFILEHVQISALCIIGRSKELLVLRISGRFLYIFKYVSLYSKVCLYAGSSTCAFECRSTGYIIILVMNHELTCASQIWRSDIWCVGLHKDVLTKVNGVLCEIVVPGIAYRVCMWSRCPHLSSNSTLNFVLQGNWRNFWKSLWSVEMSCMLWWIWFLSCISFGINFDGVRRNSFASFFSSFFRWLLYDSSCLHLVSPVAVRRCLCIPGQSLSLSSEARLQSSGEVSVPSPGISAATALLWLPGSRKVRFVQDLFLVCGKYHA